MTPVSATATVYHWPGKDGQGRCHIALCRETGFVGVSGDFLSFTYVSNPEYRREPLVPFLKLLSQRYLLTNAMGRAWEEDDLVTPTKRMREELLRRHDDDLIEKHAFHWANTELDSAECAETFDEWHGIINGDDTLSEIRDDLEIYPGDRRPTKLSGRFWNEVWTPFLATLKD